MCTYCTLNKQYKEICTLKDTVQSLTNRITELEAACKSSVSKPTTAQVMQSESPVNSTSLKLSTASVASLPPSIGTSERKFNIVVYSIPENPPKTNKETRVKEDLNILLTLFQEIDSSIESNAIKDFFRLGKFKSDSNRPRPLLVKFLRSTDTTNTLLNKTKLKSEIYIKPDLSPEEKIREAVLLKERHSLMQKGIDRKQIKL